MDVQAFQQSPAGRVIRVPGAEYWAFVPNALPPPIEWTHDLAADLSEADRALGELAGLGRVLPDPHILIAPFIRREAVLSSQIEGTQASLSNPTAWLIAYLDYGPHVSGSQDRYEHGVYPH